MRVEGVGGGDGGSGKRGAEEGKGKLGAVTEDEHDHITVADAEGVEAGGDLPGGEVDVGIGVDFSGVAVDEAWAVLEAGEVLKDVRVERKVCGDGNVGEFGAEDELFFILWWWWWRRHAGE